MKRNIKLLTPVITGIAVSLTLILTGCVTKNPAYVAGNTNNIPQYLPDPRLNAYSNSAAGLASVAAPALGPYAPLADWGVKVGFGLAGLIAGAVAAKKNRQAVIDALAAGVVKQGPVVTQGVLDHASTTNTFVAVADAINSNTGINQSNTGAPKTI